LKKLKLFWFTYLTSALLGAVILGAASLSSCTLSAPSEPAGETPDPQAVFTAAALTAEARREEQALAPTATNTLIPTLPPTPTATATEILTTTTQATNPGSTTIPPTSAGPGADRAEFVADISVPDGTVFKANEKFDKTWRIRNVGDSTWTTAYSLIFMGGDLMGSPPTVRFPKEVAPYEIVNVTIPLIAPDTAGSYRGLWKFRNATGELFGVGPKADEVFWVDIKVQGSIVIAPPLYQSLINWAGYFMPSPGETFSNQVNIFISSTQ